MAINISTLKTRSLTALVFVVVMLAGLFWNKWSFILLFTVIHFGAWWEFNRLIKKIDGSINQYNVLWGLPYLTIPICMLLQLRGIWFSSDSYYNVHQLGSLIPIGIIFSIWINDTMAYIVGSMIGKTPFSVISPKKTWEGTIGGAILCVLSITLMGKFIPMAQVISTPHWVIISTLSAVFGTLGDLLESKLKRMANVKDSGSFMPGHGGFLDRFDSLIIATPAVWLYVELFMPG